jgi:SAM-dependent methyltransferase
MINRKPWLEQLRGRMFVDPIVADPRSAQGARLGRTSDWIFRNAIGGGQADFDQPIEDLSPRDRAMLYALFNQKAHVDELIHAFTKFLPEPQSFRGATVIDIGCGPFTAGLAIANVVGGGVAYRYFGIDRASSMRLLANDLAQEVRVLAEINQDTQVSFHERVDGIDFGPQRAAEITVFVLSYLLASSTIDVDELVGEIKRASDRVGLGPSFVLYTNSARAHARAHFPVFRDLMVESGFSVHVEETERFFDTDTPRDIHYALFVRAPISTLPITQF